MWSRRNVDLDLSRLVTVYRGLMGEHVNGGSDALRISLTDARGQKEVHVFAAVGIKAPHLICFLGGSSPERSPCGLMTTHRSDPIVRREVDALRKWCYRRFLSATHLCDLLRDGLVAESVSLQPH